MNYEPPAVVPVFKCNKCRETKTMAGFEPRHDSPRPRQPCKECRKGNTRRWRANNPEKLRAQHRRHYWNNRKKLQAKNAAYYRSPKGRLRTYRRGAEQRGLVFELSMDEFMSFWLQPCSYCGGEIATIGIDRRDPAVGYVLPNCAACCEPCNIAKHTMTADEYLEHCRRVVDRSSQ